MSVWRYDHRGDLTSLPLEEMGFIGRRRSRSIKGLIQVAKQPHLCAFCSFPLTELLHESDADDNPPWNFRTYHRHLMGCSRCGWWKAWATDTESYGFGDGSKKIPQ